MRLFIARGPLLKAHRGDEILTITPHSFYITQKNTNVKDYLLRGELAGNVMRRAIIKLIRFGNEDSTKFRD